jgi:hypothetical protein
VFDIKVFECWKSYPALLAESQLYIDQNIGAQAGRFEFSAGR